jgi:hypothetical protein
MITSRRCRVCPGGELLADRMLEAKSLRRLIERFIVIRKAYFTWLESMRAGGRWPLRLRQLPELSRERFTAANKSVPDMDHYVVMKEAFCAG